MHLFKFQTPKKHIIFLSKRNLSFAKTTFLVKLVHIFHQPAAVDKRLFNPFKEMKLIRDAWVGAGVCH